MKRNWRLFFGLVGLLLLALAFWKIESVTSDLRVISTKVDGQPMVFLMPEQAQPGTRPLVLIGHGFAGSSAFMRGFAYTLAKAGFVAAIWDFQGHGQNTNPMPGGAFRGDLIPNAEAVLAEALRLGFGDPARVAILGHSMGSGVALTFGQKHPETAATIAVSPVGTNVSSELPKNLLLMAGSNEASFLQSARERLAEAGGEGGDPAQGTGRKLVVIPYVEHISIVFSPFAQQTAREWLESVFGAQPEAQNYHDQRIVWYALGVLGAVIASLALVPATSPTTNLSTRPAWFRILALVGGALAATAILALLDRLGLGLVNLFGLMVGGYLLVWFALAGLTSLLILSFSKPGKRGSFKIIRVARTRPVLLGILVALILWVGVGLLGSKVWLPWLIIPPRLILWPLGVLCLLPWFLAVGEASSPANAWGRLGWWLADSLILAGSFLLAMRLTPGLFFILLLLPLFPLVLGVHNLAAGRQRHAWAFGLSAALFIAWVLVAVFPLAGA